MSLLTSAIISLGVYFLGKFIGKRFNFSEFSYLGLAAVSFILAAILHEEVQNAILTKFTNYPFIDRTTIILLPIAFCLVAVLFIFIREDRRKEVSVDRVDGEQKPNPYSGTPPKKANKILKLFAGTEHGVLSKLNIVDMTNFNPITVQALMDELEGREFVELYIASHPDDNRYVLTEKGRRYMIKKGLLK